MTSFMREVFILAVTSLSKKLAQSWEGKENKEKKSNHIDDWSCYIYTPQLTFLL